jgi:hypothetical protein
MLNSEEEYNKEGKWRIRSQKNRRYRTKTRRAGNMTTQKVEQLK